MAPQKSPAFQFYAKDFLAGTATMTLAERGAYVTLLAHQWDAGCVPSAAKERARLLGCTPAEERRIWQKLFSKFTYTDDTWKNQRLEDERSKQAEFRRRQSDAGKASAATRKQPEGNHGLTTVESRLQPEVNSSSSSSVDPSKNDGSREPRARAAIQGSGAFEPNSLPRDHMHHSVCGPLMRFCLKTWECGELMRQYGGDPLKQKAAVVEFVKAFEQSLGPDDAIGAFSDVEKNFQTWMKSIGRLPVKLDAKPVVPIRVTPAKSEAVTEAMETRRRRSEMQASGMPESDIEAVFDREYEERRNA